MILFVIVAAAVRMPSCSAITCEVVLLFVLIIKMAGLHFPVVGRPTHSMFHAGAVNHSTPGVLDTGSTHTHIHSHRQPTSLAARMTHKRTAKVWQNV